MRVLSLFDGISCGQVALERAGFKPSIYMASEIDKEAIKVTQSNYPNTVQLGGVVGVNEMARTGLLGHVDLLIGGSPCQGFSKAGAGKGFDDPRSQLFFNYVNIKDHLKPKWFLLENVRMKKADMDLITLLMGVKPIEIDSALFSAQHRKRMYWTNIPIAPIVDKGVTLSDILGTDNFQRYKKRQPEKPLSKNKSATLTGASGHSAGNHSEMDILVFNNYPFKVRNNRIVFQGFDPHVRRYKVSECEMLQTLPVGYTKSVSQSASYRALANGWTVDVIAHILRGMR